MCRSRRMLVILYLPVWLFQPPWLLGYYWMMFIDKPAATNNILFVSAVRWLLTVWALA